MITDFLIYGLGSCLLSCTPLRGSLVTFSLLRSSLFAMISLAMIISSSLRKAALILVLNGVAGILPVTPFLLG